MKGPTGKTVSGIYGNPRFIHTAATLVGCVVNIQVRNGTMYEGVFRTLSDKVDLVVEMVYKIEKKSPSITAMLTSKFDPGHVTPKMIFPIGDVISISAVNIDLEFATRDSFTDTAISRFDGQVHERVLEPWDGGATNDELTDLGGDEVSNGWAADEMFRTNEVKYGVKSSFDDDLHDYTIPLRKQNTEEYKLQEEKACKIAQEIESSFHYKNRAALENGDEEDRFSAVVRTDASTSNVVNNNNNNSNISNNNRFVSSRARKPQGVRPIRSSPSPNAYPPPSRMPHPHLQNYHNKPSSQNMPPVAPQPKVANGKQMAPPLPQRQVASPRSVTPVSNPLSSNVSSAPQNAESNKVNGDVIRSLKDSPENNNVESTLPLTKEVPEKKPVPKNVHDEKAEDLKRFYHKFKLPDSKDPKCDKEVQVAKTQCSEGSESGSESASVQEKKSAGDKDSDYGDDDSESKSSTLNPLAKEFIFNPLAKSFTPRGQQQLPPGPSPQQQQQQLPPGPAPQQQPLPVTSHTAGNLALPPVAPVQQSPRLHAQSPVIAVPPAHIVPGMAHPMFNVAPHYVLPATPVSVPIAPPYTPATSVTQAPRYRKALPITLPRNDSSQSIHVQAATGQPILAPPTLSTPQFAIQYAPSPGILHPAGPPQPQIPYTQMYSMVGQRVITPQLGMVPAGAYGESPHSLPTQLYMNPQNVAHPGQSANSGQHSTPSTPQSQTPNLHTAPSPVHQAPPPHGQAPTPTGHPSNPSTPQVVYHGQLVAQHPLHINAASSNHNHPYPMYGAGPQPIMILPQQPMPGPHHPATFSTLQNHFHAQTSGAHVATPTQIIPHPSMAMMPTSTAMGVTSSHHYVPHSQV